jgi:hypothetical protein
VPGAAAGGRFLQPGRDADTQKHLVRVKVSRLAFLRERVRFDSATAALVRRG